jgi:hypothetical protein
MPTTAHRHLAKGEVWKFCYWSGLVILFAFAAWKRFTLPLDPIADPDTWGYLSPALRKLTGTAFGHTSGRNFVYPGFVYLLLLVFRDFRAVTVAQHILGLLAGGTLLLTWWRARVFVAHPRLSCGPYLVLGLLAAAIFLVASEPMHFEMQLRPEGVCAFLVSINLYFLAQFITCCFIQHRPLATAIYGVASVCTAIVLASVKPSFVLVCVIALCVVGVFFFQPHRFWHKALVAAGAATSVVLLLFPEYFLSRNDTVNRTFLPTTLFVIHANLIRDQMADDLRTNANVPYPRDWLQRVQAELNSEISKSGKHYKTLGFDPDYLMYNRTSIAAQLRTAFGNDLSALCAFYRFYYWRIWQHRPLFVLKKIARQLAIFYVPKCGAYKWRKLVPLADEYKRGVASLGSDWYRKTWTAYPPALPFMNRTQLLAESSLVLRQSASFGALLSFLAAMYLPLFVVALGLGATMLLNKNYRSRLGWLMTAVLFVYLYGFASCLEVATIHSLENSRYMTVQMYLAVLAQFLALWLIFEFVSELLVTGIAFRSSDLNDLRGAASRQADPALLEVLGDCRQILLSHQVSS